MQILKAATLLTAVTLQSTIIGLGGLHDASQGCIHLRIFNCSHSCKPGGCLRSQWCQISGNWTTNYSNACALLSLIIMQNLKTWHPRVCVHKPFWQLHDFCANQHPTMCVNWELGPTRCHHLSNYLSLPPHLTSVYIFSALSLSPCLFISAVKHPQLSAASEELLERIVYCEYHMA